MQLLVDSGAANTCCHDPSGAHASMVHGIPASVHLASTAWKM
jgi:hypothetical protein